MTNSVQTTLSNQTVERNKLAKKVFMPTFPIKRDQFYESTEDVRYMVKIHMSNGNQARDIPVDISNLIELHEDIKHLFEQRPDIDYTIEDSSHWTCKLQSVEKTLTDTKWRDLESQIETLMEEHNLQFHKQLRLAGRGYDDIDYRFAMVNYSFGTTETDIERKIQSEHSDLAFSEWVGGEFGGPDDLADPEFTVSTAEPTSKPLLSRLQSYIHTLLKV